MNPLGSEFKASSVFKQCINLFLDTSKSLCSSGSACRVVLFRQDWSIRSAREAEVQPRFKAGAINARSFAKSAELPLLGIDFLSFGQVKNLIVMDFQPLFQDDAYLEKYIYPLKALHDQYPDLCQDLEMKFYDANQYFSKYLLFAKTDSETVRTRVFEAFKDYLQLYWSMIDAAKPLTDPADIRSIAQAQKDYDQYSAERDPASGLFSSYFGHDWSERFLHEFLFEDAVPVAVPVR
jgi:hypothetical protein